jgi:hypothetical protein
LNASPSLAKRLGWLVLIWAVSVGALGLLAWALKLLMNAVGLTV